MLIKPGLLLIKWMILSAETCEHSARLSTFIPLQVVERTSKTIDRVIESNKKIYQTEGDCVTFVSQLSTATTEVECLRIG